MEDLITLSENFINIIIEYYNIALEFLIENRTITIIIIIVLAMAIIGAIGEIRRKNKLKREKYNQRQTNIRADLKEKNKELKQLKLEHKKEFVVKGNSLSTSKEEKLIITPKQPIIEVKKEIKDDEENWKL